MRGPDDEFAEFLARAEPRLTSYLHYAGCGADAEDVFQDVCVAAYRNWPRVRRLERPNAWLVRVARNLLVNRAKRKASRRRPPRSPEVDSAPGSDDAAASTETRNAVGAAVAALPDREREAVSMKIWADLTWVEIGRILQVSEDTAARLFARGLKALAPKLEGFAP